MACKPCQNLHMVVNEAVLIKSNNCPEKSACTLELVPNKTITFKKDTTGVLYPEISEGEKTLLKYTFKKNALPNIQDSNYSEIIYAELNEAISEITLVDKELQNIKLYFGRLCFCKGETGYFPIKKGAFKISKGEKKSINVDFDFIIKDVPQVITHINESISLK
jgi:hypothetical protein